MLQTMFAHAQYCSSGDETLAGARAAIDEVGAAEADEHLAIVVSDANLRRYGIKVDDVNQVLTVKHSPTRARPVFCSQLDCPAQGEHTRVLAENADGDSSRRVRAVMLFIASIGEEVRISCALHLVLSGG